MLNPLVSIVVPLYNYSQYIGGCIQSIINQTYENFELIVVDDCSTDDSYEVAKKYKSDKVSVIKMTKNSGYSKAKNKGIIISKGEFITTLDADDFLTKESIAHRVKKLRKGKALFVHGNALNIGKSTTLEEAYKKKGGRRGHPRIHAQTVMVHRSVYQKFGLYDENLRSRSDKEMWWRLFGKNDNQPAKIKKLYTSVDVAYYRVHDKSMMAMRSKNKSYNIEVSKLLKQAYRIRRKEGITKTNTRFLLS